MSVQLKTYRGIPVYVRQDGRFEATIVARGMNPEQVVNKSLAEVERAIDTLVPRESIVGLSVMFCGGSPEHASLRDIDEPRVVQVVGIRERTTGRGRNAYVQRELLDSDGRQVSGYGPMYRHNPGVQAILENIVERGRALVDEWRAAVGRLTPISRDEITRLAEDAASITSTTPESE